MEKNRPHPWRHCYPVAAILLATLAVYFNALYNGFVHDDLIQVLDNPWIKSMRFIREILGSDVWGYYGHVSTNYYRPVMHLTYMAEYRIFGQAAWGFHLVNVVMHAGAAVLVYFIGNNILGGRGGRPGSVYLSPPLVAAILFAVHPIHTEAVTWIAGVPELTYTLFFLLSLYLYITASGGIGLRIFASAFFFFAALLSKEPAMALPTVIIAYDYSSGALQGNRLNAALKRYLPYAAAIAVYLAMRLNALGGMAPVKWKTDVTPYQDVINSVPLFTEYLKKLLFPFNLNLFQQYSPVISITDPKFMVAIFIATVFMLAAWLAVRKEKLLLVPVAMMVVPMLPVLVFSMVGRNGFGERYLYLPSAGFLLTTSYFISRSVAGLRNGRALLAACVAVMALSFTVWTVERNADWKDEYTILTDSLRRTDNIIARIGYGDCLIKKGMTDAAVSYIAGIVKDYPESFEAHYSMGKALSLEGNQGRAIAEYLRALSLNPSSAEARSALGLAYGRQGRLDDSISQLELAVRMNPYLEQAHLNLGVAYGMKGRKAEAREQFKKALSLNPEDKLARDNLEYARSVK